MSQIPEGANVSIFSKNQAKAKEAIVKLGVKKVAGITRVTFRQKDNKILVIEEPEVYQSQGGTYIVFGEPKVEDFAAKIAATQQQQVENVADKSPSSIQADMEAAASAPAVPAPAAADDEVVDETGLTVTDIELVMEQANVSRAQAAKALRDNNSDIVNAIMSLSQ